MARSHARRWYHIITTSAAILADDITNLTSLAPRTFRQWAEHHVDAFK